MHGICLVAPKMTREHERLAEDKARKKWGSEMGVRSEMEMGVRGKWEMGVRVQILTE